MSGKRGADVQLTQDSREDEEYDDTPKGPVRASAEVLAKRKILKPRSRLAKSTGASMTTGFSFGSKPVESEQKANPFGGFAPTPQASKPVFAFGAPSNTVEEAPKTNPFGFLKASQPTEVSTAQSVLAKVGQTTSNTALVSTKSTEKASKIKALNDNFYTKITQERTSNPVSNFTPILKKYIDYYEKIDKDYDMTDADSVVEQKALPAPTSSFNFVQPVTKPITAAPAFAFGQANKEEEKSRSPTPMEQSQENTKDEIIDVDSESDSDDDIKVEGPQFTLAKLPTTTDSAFKLSKDAPTTTSSGTGPTFTFAGASKNFDSPFKLTKPVEEKKEEEKKKDPTDTPKPAFGSTNNFTWSPGQPINFSKDTKDDTNTETESKPVFNFSAPVSSDAPKPTFNFGSTASDSAEEKKEDAPKPSFSFGSVPTSTPSFNFGAASSAKPAFNFGSTSEKPSFNFGGTKPAAIASGGFNFNFSGSKPETTTDSNEAADAETVPEEEADVNFKPVVEMKEKVEEKTGEEEEDLKYAKRAKVLLYAPEEESNYVTKGLGELKVLTNKETGKSRILVRAEGGGRPILNIPVVKEFTYSIGGKGAVKVPNVTSTGLETYVIRVKTDEDALNLLNALKEAQN